MYIYIYISPIRRSRFPACYLYIKSTNLGLKKYHPIEATCCFAEDIWKKGNKDITALWFWGFWAYTLEGLTWNLQITHLERKMIWPKPPWGHVPAVNLEGCSSSFENTAFFFRKCGAHDAFPCKGSESMDPSMGSESVWQECILL